MQRCGQTHTQCHNTVAALLSAKKVTTLIKNIHITHYTGSHQQPLL